MWFTYLRLKTWGSKKQREYIRVDIFFSRLNVRLSIPPFRKLTLLVSWFACESRFWCQSKTSVANGHRENVFFSVYACASSLEEMVVEPFWFFLNRRKVPHRIYTLYSLLKYNYCSIPCTYFRYFSEVFWHRICGVIKKIFDIAGYADIHTLVR